MDWAPVEGSADAGAFVDWQRTPRSAQAGGRPARTTSARRQRQAAGQAFHLVLHHVFGLAAGVGVGGDQQVLEDFFSSGLTSESSILTPFSSPLALS